MCLSDPVTASGGIRFDEARHPGIEGGRKASKRTGPDPGVKKGQLCIFGA